MAESDPNIASRLEKKLITYIISPPVRELMTKYPDQRIDLIISPAEAKGRPDLGVKPARDSIEAYIKQNFPEAKVGKSDFYVFATLLPSEIEKISNLPDLWQVWLDHKISGHLLTSAETVKATACWRTFDARGKGITWAVLDSGIKYNHPHFQNFGNIDRTLSKNFSASTTEEDVYGHGTHVAGIIAGCPSAPGQGRQYRVATYLDDPTVPKIDVLDRVPSGIAPVAKLVNIKVMDDDGTGSSSSAILGLQYIRNI